MSHNKNCPECGKNILSKFNRCACGWRKQDEQESVYVDYDCQYQNQGKRCKLPCSMSISTRGGGTWYCSYHYRSLDDPKKGEEMLGYIEKNYEKIMEERIDWRRKLFPDDFRIIKPTIIKKETS
jgi:hypothetical protein